MTETEMLVMQVIADAQRIQSIYIELLETIR